MRSKTLMAGLFILLCVSSGCISFGNGADGYATDSIARVSYGGWIWKTWRVQLTNDHPIDGNPMQYGVLDDKNVIEQLQHYADTGEKVKISYHGNIFVYDWEYSDAEVIYDVKPI